MPEIGEIRLARLIGYKGHARFIFQACADCGKLRWVQFRRGEAISSKCRACLARGRNKRMGAESNGWKGGRTESRGYVSIKLQPDDFLYRWSIVTDMFLSKNDNRLENLELLPGQGKHNTMLENEIKKQAELIKELQARVTILEAELALVGYNEPRLRVTR